MTHSSATVCHSECYEGERQLQITVRPCRAIRNVGRRLLFSARIQQFTSRNGDIPARLHQRRCDGLTPRVQPPHATNCGTFQAGWLSSAVTSSAVTGKGRVRDGVDRRNVLEWRVELRTDPISSSDTNWMLRNWGISLGKRRMRRERRQCEEQTQAGEKRAMRMQTRTSVTRSNMPRPTTCCRYCLIWGRAREAQSV